MTPRDLPSVEEVLQGLDGIAAHYPRRLVVDETRKAIDSVRTALLQGAAEVPDIEGQVAARLRSWTQASLRRVINATGVVLHTNLGRAPLASLPRADGYTNLEYDLDSGKRGKRDVHVGKLIEQLTGAPGIAVNNNAAAIFLALNELASGAEVVVSRGELIEIGDGFRIPDIMARSGAILREVGATNRTSLEDYRQAITSQTRMLLRVHPSNFRIEGFTAKPPLSDLAQLARERNLILYEDLGSGCVSDLSRFGIDEPLAAGSIKLGADLISFSGDKLLGGPQAGILSGRAEIVARLRRNPLFRALRLDKLILGALETTLRHAVLEQWDRIPALRMIALTLEELRERATRIARRVNAGVLEGESVIGGGSTPAQSLPTCLVAVDHPDVPGLERRLRSGEPPVVARIEGGRLLIDPRTVLEDEEAGLIEALRAAMR